MGRCSLTSPEQQLKMGKGQNEGGFSEEQLQMYKDCFKLMDINKDGQLDKNDLRGAFDNVGKMFQEKMAGEGNDPDDLIVQAFKAYDNEGKIDSKMFEHALKTWGDKMTKAEIDDIIGEFEIDEDYMIKTKDVIGLFPSRRSPRLRSPHPLRRPLRRNLRKTQMPRRRRRPPSKCHLLTVEAVEKCSKHSFYLRALKITVIRNPFNCVLLYLCGHAVYHPATALALFCKLKKITKKRKFAEKKNSRKKKKKKKKKK